MREMWQQDVFRYLTNRYSKPNTEDPGLEYGLRIPIKIVSGDLDLPGGDARLSNFINGNRKIAYQRRFDAADVVDKLVMPLIDAGNLDPGTELARFHTFLQVEGIADRWKPVTDFRECLTAAFTEALRRHVPAEVQIRLRNDRIAPNRFFTGRDADLSALRELLDENGAVVLRGVGGIGKTVLASEYARRNAGKYESCQVVTAGPFISSWKDLIRSVRFDRSAGAPVQTAPEENVALTDSLDSSSLLIFDNVDTAIADTELFRHILKESGAHIIVTTRLSGGFDDAAIMELHQLDEADQLRLLAQSMGRSIDQDEMADAEEICRAAGGHTLLIQLLGRAMRASGEHCSEMLEKLQGLNGFEAMRASVRVHKDSFNRTVRIRDFIADLLFSVSSLSDGDKDLLRSITVLPPEGAPISLLEQSFTNRSALEPLADRGWLMMSEDGSIVRMHPVVREAVLSRMKADSNTCTDYLAALTELMAAPIEEDMRPHLINMVSTAVDMLYITDPLRTLLLSDKLQPLYGKAYNILQDSGIWSALRCSLTALSEQDSTSPDDAARLRMFGLYCDYVSLAGPDAVMYEAGLGDVIDAGVAGRAVPEDVSDEQVEATAKELAKQFVELRAEDIDEEDRKDITDPVSFWQYVLRATTLEFLEYMDSSGLMRGIQLSDNARMRDIAAIFAGLDEADTDALRSVSVPVFGAFLSGALEFLAQSLVLAPLMASAAVNLLTLLHVLLAAGSDQIQSFEEAAAFRGWHFPQITHVPKGYTPAEFSFAEDLWGRPEAVQTYIRGPRQLIVSMERLHSDNRISRFDVMGSAEVNSPTDRRIRIRQMTTAPWPEVEVEIGQWRVIITVTGRVSKKELLAAALGIRLHTGSGQTMSYTS